MNQDKHHTPIAQVLGRIPSGIFVLTVGDDTGRETGMLASWVQQASFDPPEQVLSALSLNLHSPTGEPTGEPTAGWPAFMSSTTCLAVRA